MQHGEPDTVLQIWTIYDHPKDIPDQYVARLWVVGEGGVTATNEMFTADTLDELRSLLPPGLTCMSRNPNDDPCIVETWL